MLEIRAEAVGEGVGDDGAADGVVVGVCEGGVVGCYEVVDVVWAAAVGAWESGFA